MTLDAALDVLSLLVLEDGRRWGEVAEPEQWNDARAVLDPKPATPYSFLTRARGRSKTTDLAGMVVAAMLTQTPAGAQLYGAAADRDQARLLVDSIEGFVRRTPLLRGAFEIGAFKVTAVASGASLECLPADAASSWGLRPYFVVVDEIAQWPTTNQPKALWESISSAAAKVPDCRMVLLTSAGDPAHWSYKILVHARQSDLWRVHEVAGPPPWMDSQRLGEQRARLPESSFRRLFLNEWTTAEDRLTNLADLQACVTLDGPQKPRPGFRYVIGLDIGIKRDRSVAVVCHLERSSSTGEDSRVVLDRIQVWQGSRTQPVQLRQVEEWILEAHAAYGGARLVFDPWQAVGLTQSLRKHGVPTTEFTFSSASVGRLGATLHMAFRNRSIALPDDEALIEELANVRLRETTPGVLRLDHDPDQHDDRAVALALAVQHLRSRRERPKGAIPVGLTRGMPLSPRGAVGLDDADLTEGKLDLGAAIG